MDTFNFDVRALTDSGEVEKCFFTVRNGVCSRGGSGLGGGLVPGVEGLVSQHALRQTPPPGETATAADGTHPTGMHSCSSYKNRLWSKTQLEKSGTKLTLYNPLTLSATLKEERSQNHEKLQLP